jgi:hypothetical protein
MRRATVSPILAPLLLHNLCGAVAVAIALALIQGRPGPAVAAVLMVAAMVTAAAAPQTSLRDRAPAARRPGFHAYLLRRAGTPRRPMTFLYNLLLRPLTAGSFAGFWRDWNPPLGYVLLFFVYRPARRLLPRPIATHLTFLASGLIHDLAANAGDLLRGTGRVDLSGTLLLAIFGILTVASEAAGMDLSHRPGWVRGAANAGLLAAGFAMRRLLLSMCGTDDEDQQMAEVTTHIPDDLHARVRSHLTAHGEDLASFTARAFDELLAVDEDPLLHAELVGKSRKALEEIDAGQVLDARQAMREIAAEKRLKFSR